MLQDFFNQSGTTFYLGGFVLNAIINYKSIDAFNLDKILKQSFLIQYKEDNNRIRYIKRLKF